MNVTLLSPHPINQEQVIHPFAVQHAATISPTIADLATLLVAPLATVENLPSVANSTMSLTMTMTMTTALVFHGCDSITGTFLGVESVVANEWTSVGIFDVKNCWLFLSRGGV